MRDRIAARLFVIAVAFSMNGLIPVAFAAEDDATGIWKWKHQEAPGRVVEVVLTLKQDGEKLSGKIKSPRSELEIEDGKVQKGELSFCLTTNRNGNIIRTKYRGRIKGQDLKGKVEVERNGQFLRSVDWKAARSPD